MEQALGVIGGEMDAFDDDETQQRDGTRRGLGSGSSHGPLTLLGDSQLAWLAGRGNQRAFEILYGRYQQPLYAYCLSILRSAHDAHDALQNTMLKAFKGLANKQDRKLHLKPWLYRIAHNESISLIRSRKSQDRFEEATLDLALAPEADSAVRDRLTELLDDLRELPERQRSALVMRELGGLSYREIAETLSTSEQLATQAVYEARAGLHEFAAGRELGCELVRQTVSRGDRRMLRSRRVRAHLRVCTACEQFDRATRQRSNDLGMILPGLSGGGISGLLQRLAEAGASSGPVVGGASLTGAAAAGSGVIGQATATLGGGKTVATLLTVLAAGSSVAGVESAKEIVSEPSRESVVTKTSVFQQTQSNGAQASTPSLVVPERDSSTESSSAGGEPRKTYAGSSKDESASRAAKLPPATSTGVADEVERLLNRADQGLTAARPTSDQTGSTKRRSALSPVAKKDSERRSDGRSKDQQLSRGTAALQGDSVVEAAEQLLAESPSNGF